MDIIIATHNENKLKEIKEIFNNDSINLISLSELNYVNEIEEFGISLEQNALIKAQCISKIYPNHIVIADDSGLEVKALNGAPGVYSARYANEKNDFRSNKDKANNKKLLSELRNKLDRKAKFRTVLCVIEPKKLPRFYEGAIEGEILYEEKGENGFGYDPLFCHDGLHSFAQLSEEEKNSISHRYNAFSNFSEEFFK